MRAPHFFQALLDFPRMRATQFGRIVIKARTNVVKDCDRWDSWQATTAHRIWTGCRHRQLFDAFPRTHYHSVEVKNEMSDSKANPEFGHDIIARWFEDGGITSQTAMVDAKTKLTELLARSDETDVKDNWLANQNTFALWCLIEIELEQCPAKCLRDLVFAMRGDHEFWFGKLLFSLAIYLYESKAIPQTREGVHLIPFHAITWAEIMLLHSVLSAYKYDPEPEIVMGVKFRIADYQELDERFKSGASTNLPGVGRLLEELMGYGDPVAEYLLGLEEDHDSDLIRDASDSGFVLASYYGALRADGLQKRNSSAASFISSKLEKEMFLRRITIESVSEYLARHENTLDGLSEIGSSAHPVTITKQDWSFFAGVTHHAQELFGNPKAGGLAPDFWLESEKKFDDNIVRYGLPSAEFLSIHPSKSLRSIKEQYDLVRRCQFRLQLAEQIISHRKEYLFNLVVESAKLFEAILKACIIHFNRCSSDKISKTYVHRTRAEQSKPDRSKDVPDRIVDADGTEWRGRDRVYYALSSRDDCIAKECKNPANPALNEYIFEVLDSIQCSSLEVPDWKNGVQLTWNSVHGVLGNSCNIRSLLVAIALTAFVRSDHPFRSLWLSADKDGLKSLIKEAYGLYHVRNKSGGAHFVPNGLGLGDAFEQVGKVFALADKVIAEVLIDS